MRHYFTFARVSALAALCALTATAYAQTPSDDLAPIIATWADVKYRQVNDPQRPAKSKALEADAAAVAERYPDNAEALFWQANVLCLTAEIIHSMASLGNIRHAQELLETAEKLDPKSSEVEALLGGIYYEVPGWPISFGSNTKAADHLQRAVALNPDGMNAHFFMADFLLQRGRAGEAIPHFEKALIAADALPSSAARDGRREEIEKGLADARRRAGRKDG